MPLSLYTDTDLWFCEKIDRKRINLFYNLKWSSHPVYIGFKWGEALNQYRIAFLDYILYLYLILSLSCFAFGNFFI